MNLETVLMNAVVRVQHDFCIPVKLLCYDVGDEGIPHCLTPPDLPLKTLVISGGREVCVGGINSQKAFKNVSGRQQISSEKAHSSTCYFLETQTTM